MSSATLPWVHAEPHRPLRQLAPASDCHARVFRDSMKSFGNFMWEAFAGFSLVTDYQKRDFFEDIISAIGLARDVAEPL